MTPAAIWTIGHSTHPAGVFVGLLTRHGIGRLADIRTVPKSLRHPQFNQQTLDGCLRQHDIAYRHFAALGGLRKPRPDSVNTAWLHPGFRGYADYMLSEDFRAGVSSLLEFASGPTAVMCAEAVWWRCHRRLLADALLVRGVAVWHILPSGPLKTHQLSEFARIDGSRLTYPGLM